MLALYRLGLHPVTGINVDCQRRLASNFKGSKSSDSSISSRGGASRACAVRVGIMPTSRPDHPAVAHGRAPVAEKLQKEGEVGQQKITQYTRYLTVGLAFASRSATSLPVQLQLVHGGATSPIGERTFTKVFLIVIC